ncbi:helix-turn-helix transcriptional regulator [Nocardia terpenica]|uniref:WYL domain-containing protein n=1 Tax=Nocardia terpenica TaxID=455432 RepID=A0A6G9Z4V5_9NOCA|nr:YafY family protein [Nocardia terpenica]QIS20635.1 WYL domain-containing protein [Nocardia terpenica]
MNRTDRLYALVEELRAVAPRRRSARELAARYEVSVRTIERDIAALQQSGVPIYADVGRTGGYTLDKRMSLPPLNFSPAEAVAVGVALRRMRGTPFDTAGASALTKIVTAMSDESADAARDLARMIGVVESTEEPPPAPFAALVCQAVQQRRVIDMSYIDRAGAVTDRAVEPTMLMCGSDGWYLIGWCRLRDGSRVFRLDRITAAALAESIAARPPRPMTGEMPPERVVRTVEF